MDENKLIVYVVGLIVLAFIAFVGGCSTYSIKQDSSLEYQITQRYKSCMAQMPFKLDPAECAKILNEKTLR